MNSVHLWLAENENSFDWLCDYFGFAFRQSFENRSIRICGMFVSVASFERVRPDP